MSLFIGMVDRSPDLGPRVLDVLVVSFMMAGLAIFNHLALSSRPPEYIGHGLPVLAGAMSFYFVLPGPLLARAGGSIAMGASMFFHVQRAATPPIGLNAMIASHIIVHLVGIPMARRFESVRREAFFAQLAERRAREELAQKAADLEIARDKAEALAKVKTEFLATMSHELRTPMNAVLGLSDVLVETPLAPEQKELVRTIHGSARSLLVLINDILDLAKVEAGRMTVAREPFDLRELVDGAVELIHYQAAQRSLVVQVSISPDVPRGLAGDAARLRQVLLNLLSNAVKFTKHGRVDVRVWARRLPDASHEVCFAVDDTGIGISASTLERLFTPFEQGDIARASHAGGTGLGLVISKRLVELMGGTISARSEPGRGSTFEFSVRGVAAEPPARRSSADLLPVPQGRTIRILLAEDNLINQRVARAMLERLGCQADVVGNGRDAVSAALQKEYDIILMDLRMPEMDGLEATRQIAACLPQGRRPRIVAMTASAFEDDRIATRDAGMDGFVSKPVELEALREVLVQAGAAARPAQRSSVEVPRESGARPVDLAAPSRATLSKSALDRLRELESPDAPGFFADVCRQFVSDAKARIGRMKDAALAGDATPAERQAHSLKSMSAMIGATIMSDRCAELEAAAHKADLSGFLDGAAWLDAELVRVERALEAEIGGRITAA